MPYIVPNATDIGSLYNSLDQAEPDALDFQILGDRSTGVLNLIDQTTGQDLESCKVSALPVATTSISVNAGFVALKGVVYRLNKSGAPIVSSTIVSLPSIISNNKRFDLVVGRLTNGVMEVVVLSGPESENNPTFPASPSRLGVLPAVPTHYFNPDTDVALASVYRVGGNVTTQAHIVDKRVNVMSTTMIRGSAVPSNSFGFDGDFYYRLNSGPLASGLYLKRDGVWVELILESDFRAANPIGAIMMWPGTVAPNATYWKECNGQTLSKTEYAELFSVLGTTYGEGTSTTFVLPDLRNKFVRGSETVGSSGGSDTVTLGISNLPAHSHGIGNHVHNIGNHTHNLSAQNQNVTTSEAGDHTHFGDTAGNEVVVRLKTNPLGNYVIPYSSKVAGYADGMHYNYPGPAGQGLGGAVTGQGGIMVNSRETTSVAGRHSHTYLLNLTGVVDPPTGGFTGTSTSSNTDETGSGTPFSNLPVYANMRWFIKVR